MKHTLFLLMFFLPFYVLAVTPQFWEENTQQQFESGDPQMVSITSDGELMLAPQLKKIYSGTDSIIWKILSDGQNVYAATGNEGKVLKIDASGKATPLLDTNELEVQSMLLDKDGNLFAATSPDGKVYKIKKDGTSQIYYDPSDKYIWSMAFDDAGNLYIATGDQGKIYRVDKNGKGDVFADTTEANVTTLLWDKEKGLLAGSDRNGILYAIEPNGKISVLFDSDQQQITSIYRNSTGEIYFAAITGVGVVAPESRSMQPPAPTQPVSPPQQQSDDNNDEASEGTVVTTVEVMPVVPQPSMPPAKPTAAQLYRINPDGTSELMYSSENHILDIQSSNDDDSVILSTGKESRLIKLTKNKKSTILLKTAEDQITSLISGKRVLLATANPGNVYELVQSHSSSGTYFSDIKDAGTASAWGRLTWKSETPAGTAVTLSVRSGNTKSPDETWSAWTSAGNSPSGQQISSPKGRFVQWKADFNTTNNETTPILRSVKLAYLQQNLRPSVDAIVVLPAGSVYKKTSFGQDRIAGASDSDIETGQQAETQQAMQATFAGKADYRKGYQTITWNASDANQDTLQYEVYYRPVNEKSWKLLAKDLKETIFAWDTQTIPDGTYLLQVRVTDQLSNPGSLALTNSKESAPFDVDNSSPKLEVTQVSKNGNSTIIQVKAEDQFSPIKQMQYSVTPGAWVQVFPVDSIADSPLENYRIEIADLPSGADTIVLKCSDQFQNVSTIRHALSATK
jgi:sugar lactone lactonase YvrE